MTTYYRDHYGRSAEPANNNEQVPFVSPAHVEMHAGIAEMRQTGHGGRDARRKTVSTVASSHQRTAIPIRKYTSDIGDDDE